MPLPASINDLSTTAASNSPAGSESSGTADDYLRTYAAYIASLRDVVLSGTASVSTLNITYTGTLTGGTGVVNIGSGQVYKDLSGNIGLGVTNPSSYTGGRVVVAGSGESNLWVTTDPGSNTSFRGVAFGQTANANIMGSVRMQANSGELRVDAGYAGYGGFSTFYTNGLERMTVKTSGQVRFTPMASDPAAQEAGDVYFNSTTSKLRVYTGSAWVDLH